MNRRNLLGRTLAFTLASPMAAMAQQAPLRILVGFPAGGSNDTIARHLAQGLSEQLKRSVVVENRPGAGGQIAANVLKAAAPDGNTLFLSNSHALAMIPLTVRQPGYDTVQDFAPVSMVAISNDVLAVNPAVVGDVRDLRGLVQWGNAHPGKLNVGVPAPASDPDFGVRILARDFKGDLTPVPYRGDGPVVQDLAAGQIPAGIGSIGAMMQYAKAGKVRIIAMSGPARLSALHDVQTYVEQGLRGYGVSGFVALVVRSGTSADAVQRYNQAVAKVVGDAGFQAKISELGVVPAPSTPEELASRIRDTGRAFASMIERSGYQMP